MLFQMFIIHYTASNRNIALKLKKKIKKKIKIKTSSSFFSMPYYLGASPKIDPFGILFLTGTQHIACTPIQFF